MPEGIMMEDGNSGFVRGKVIFLWTRLSIAIPSWIPPEHGQLQHPFTGVFLSMDAAVMEDILNLAIHGISLCCCHIAV